MPTRSKKERLQIAALAVILVIILGAVVFLNRDAFIPSTARPATVTPSTRTATTLRAAASLFEDARWNALRNNLGAPLRTSVDGNPTPFAPPPVVVPVP